jgi:glycosyltransferase involved in cell wall biosynthesis
MDIAFIDPLVTVPINCGHDWYAFSLLDDLAENNDVTHYFTQKAAEKQGYQPASVRFKTSPIKSRKTWGAVSKRFKLLELLRPEILWDKSSVRHIIADVVFTHAETYHIGRVVAHENKAPLVLMMQDIMWQKWKSNGSPLFVPIRLVENHALRKASAIIAVSPKEYAYATQHASEDRIFYVPPKIDSDIFNSTDANHHDYGTDKLKVLFYGSLDRIQNIKAAQYLAKELIPSLRRRGMLGKISVNVVGSGRPPSWLEQGRTGELCFLGEVVDIASYIRGADVVIVPVRNPCGMKIRILESLACGTPVVATREAVAGLPDHLKHAVYVATEEEGFEEILQRFVLGDLPLSISVGATTQSTASASTQDVLNYVSNHCDTASA